MRNLFGQQCSTCGILSSYADDTTYTVADRLRTNNQNNLTRALNKLAVFLNDSQLFINLPKTSITECMLKQMKGRTPGTPPSLQVTKMTGEIKMIKDKLHTRVLGANIQSNVLWTAHLD